MLANNPNTNTGVPRKQKRINKWQLPHIFLLHPAMDIMGNGEQHLLHECATDTTSFHERPRDRMHPNNGTRSRQLPQWSNWICD